MAARTSMRSMAAVTAAACLSVTACTADSAESDDETADAGAEDVVDVPTVSPPPSRETPFCQAMLELDEELPVDPAVDTGDQILTAYREALPLVPAVIAAEFAAVIRSLETGTTVTLPSSSSADTTAPPSEPTRTAAEPITEDTFFEEGYLPDDDPATRVNAYIDFACRGIQNNPGPPATQPDAPRPTVVG